MSDAFDTKYDYAPAAGRGPEETVIHTSAAGLIDGNIKIPASDRDIPAYMARPSHGGRHPVVLVISEAFGLHEHIRDIARRFAHEGCLAVAPDLMARQDDPSSFSDVGELVQKLLLQIPDEQVMAGLGATLALAIAHDSDGCKVAVTGFCWGGRWRGFMPPDKSWRQPSFGMGSPMAQPAVCFLSTTRNPLTSDRRCPCGQDTCAGPVRRAR